MRLDQIKERLIEQYPGEKWKWKVYSMPPAQAIAIYKKFQKEGRFDPRHKRKPPLILPKEETHQIDIWEYMRRTENERNQTEE